MINSKNAKISFLTAYSAWGFYKGFNNKGYFFNMPKNELYIDRFFGGMINGIATITFFPLSIIYDIRNVEKFIRNK